MSRRRKADKREILPDPKFGDLVLSKFMAFRGQETTSGGLKMN